MQRVLVLGAGASKAYGYPLGSELRSAILSIDIREAARAGIIDNDNDVAAVEHFIKFQSSFRHSQLYSVDAFLALRQEYAEVGKLCIAFVLLKCERSEWLVDPERITDNWYQYIFNKFATCAWDELNFNDLAVVTFNYDRSLQHFLITALQSAYGKPLKEARSKVLSLRIVHVYGTICSKLPQQQGYINYDGVVYPEKLKAAAAELEVIPEGRVNSPTLLTAREWLSAADSICFLGFGFDSINVERLAHDDACVAFRLGPRGWGNRPIVGTCLGMTQREIASAYAKLSTPKDGKTNMFKSEIFENLHCTALLRETLFLG